MLVVVEFELREVLEVVEEFPDTKRQSSNRNPTALTKGLDLEDPVRLLVAREDINLVASIELGFH
jgi:hypothetical protein